jgi:ElaB/YqjD/DUF883 family membrane-anchored ribosome-binding protein
VETLNHQPVHDESQEGIFKMNDQQLEKKIRQDAAKMKKDLNTLAEHSAARISRLEDNVTQATGKAKGDLTKWVEDGTSQLSDGFEKLSDNAKKTAVSTVATVKKDVGHGLSQYNAKAQEVADKVPGDFGKQAAKYPWVAISIAMAVGFILGSLLRPAQQPLG